MSLTDVVTSIVGDLPVDQRDEPMIVRRDDGSWLLDGTLDLATLMRTLAGLLAIDEGHIEIGGTVVDDPATDRVEHAEAMKEIVRMAEQVKMIQRLRKGK